MTAVRCPRCRDEVTVPARAPASARVRCPLCTEEYLLADALAEAPPALILLDLPAEPEPAYHQPYASPAAASYGEAAAVSEPAAEEEPGLAMFDASPAVGEAPPTPAFRATPRRKPKAKNPLIEMVKVVAGGVVGIAAAVLILWWCPWPRDPFGLGPKVAAFVPALVPAAFRGAAGALKGTSGAAPAQAGGNGGKGSGALGSEFGSGGLAGGTDLAQALENAKASSNSPKKKGKTPTQQPAPELMPSELTPTLDPLAPAIDPLAPEVKIGNPLDLGSPSSPAEPKPAPPPATEPEPPVFRFFASDLQSALEKAQGAVASLKPALEAYRTDKTAESLEQAKNLGFQAYSSISELAIVATYVDTADEENQRTMGEVKKLVAETAADSAMLNMISNLALRNLDNAPEEGEVGITLYGTVQGMKSAGRDLYETSLAIPQKGGEARVVPVLSRVKPEEHLQAGEPAIVLGTIMKNPKTQLKGFTGDHPQAVFGGFAVALPKKSE